LGLKLEQLVLDAPELDIRLLASGHWRILSNIEAVLAATGEEGFRDLTEPRP
jgi:hypothetical protein